MLNILYEIKPNLGILGLSAEGSELQMRLHWVEMVLRGFSHVLQQLFRVPVVGLRWIRIQNPSSCGG